MEEHDPDILRAVEKLVEDETRGDPESPLKWTSKSVEKLSKELERQGWAGSAKTVSRLLRHLGYSLQAPRKTRDGKGHPDRDAQFRYINKRVKAVLRSGQPVISVDCKKKELVGDFSNPGREYHSRGKPPKTRVHDFIDPDLGKAIPYGIYDIGENNGWVSVGVDHETAEFAVESIRRWWRSMGRLRYEGATRLLITADGGGSNGSRNKLWKVELQRLADEYGLEIEVVHFPPGTSKWNKIEHRMWSQVQNS